MDTQSSNLKQHIQGKFKNQYRIKKCVKVWKMVQEQVLKRQKETYWSAHDEELGERPGEAAEEGLLGQI